MRRPSSLVVLIVSLFLTKPASASTLITCNSLLVGDQILQKKSELEPEIWLPLAESLRNEVSLLTQPLAHGTFVNELKGIIASNGFKVAATSDAFDKNSICFSDLRKPDGWMAPYGFAIREQWQSLSVVSQEVTERDLARRYADVNKVFDGWFVGAGYRFLLRKIIKKYLEIRKNSLDGYPTYLILDGKNEISDLRYPNPKFIPSEVRTQLSVSASNLRIVLAPAARLAELKAFFEETMLPKVSLYPIELFELEEIHRYRTEQK